MLVLLDPVLVLEAFLVVEGDVELVRNHALRRLRLDLLRDGVDQVVVFDPRVHHQELLQNLQDRAAIHEVLEVVLLLLEPGHEGLHAVEPLLVVGHDVSEGFELDAVDHLLVVEVDVVLDVVDVALVLEQFALVLLDPGEELVLLLHELQEHLLLLAADHPYDLVTLLLHQDLLLLKPLVDPQLRAQEEFVEVHEPLLFQAF